MKEKLMDIGFIGLGNMGGAMAVNILKAGYKLTGHDRRPEAKKLLQENGGTWAATPREVAASSDIVFTSLPGPKEVEAVALGKDGVSEGIRPGAVYIDLTTSTPMLARRIAGVLAERKAHMMDAPVAGGPPVARSARLTVMAGGDEDIFNRCLPVLKAIGDTIVYTGGVGTACICKLVHNLIAYSYMFIAGEGMTLGVKAGVSPRVMWRVLKDGGVGRGNFFKRVLPEIYLPGRFEPPNFTVNLAVKDISLALDLAREFEVPMPMSQMTLPELIAAAGRGWGEKDSRIAMLLQEERAGNVEVRVSDAEIAEEMADQQGT
ncbi:MAG: NAD(P)-dependent oxidoreductase [Chloroflexota bacterium]